MMSCDKLNNAKIFSFLRQHGGTAGFAVSSQVPGLWVNPKLTVCADSCLGFSSPSKNDWCFDYFELRCECVCRGVFLSHTH